MSPEWFVFYTYPKAEKVLKTKLEQQGYEAFVPTTKVTRQWKDRKKVIEAPLFPNYIFVRTIIDHLYDILAVPRLVRYVSFEGKPAKVKDNDIEFIKKICSGNNNVLVANLRKGDKILIKDGVLKGYEGWLIECDGKKRFGIQLKEINQTVFIDLMNTRFKKLSPVCI